MDNLIGQRFSLISKSEIRYVGTLHEINPEQSTIALEDVLSYGTEDRQVQNFIPPSTQRFEYIVFRGSDVKDIKQADEAPEAQPPTQPPNDPAILNSSRPGPGPNAGQSIPSQDSAPNRGESPFPPNYPPPGYGGYYPPPPHNQFGRGYGPPPGTFGPGPGHPPYGPPPGYYGPPGQGFPPGPNRFGQPPPPIGPPGHRGPPPQQQQHQPPKDVAPREPAAAKPTQELPVDKNSSRSGSKSSTPAPQPTQAPQAPQAPQTQEKSATPQPGPQIPATVVAKAPAAHHKAGKVTPAMPFTVNQRSFVPPPNAQQSSQPIPAAKPAPSQVDMDQASRQAREAVAAATARIAAQTASVPQAAPQSTSVDALADRMANMNTYAPNTRGRGAGRGFRGARTSSGGPRPKMEIPKSDFDFESANAKFNKEDLVKEAIASGSPLVEDDNTHAGPVGRKDSTQSSGPIAYNKSSSFFDNISSETKDREENRGVNGRALRGQEFSKNIETFGQGNVDNYRGRGRGRGRYRGRGRGEGNFRGRGQAQSAPLQN